MLMKIFGTVCWCIHSTIELDHGPEENLIFLPAILIPLMFITFIVMVICVTCGCKQCCKIRYIHGMANNCVCRKSSRNCKCCRNKVPKLRKPLSVYKDWYLVVRNRWCRMLLCNTLWWWVRNQWWIWRDHKANWFSDSLFKAWVQGNHCRKMWSNKLRINRNHKWCKCNLPICSMRNTHQTNSAWSRIPIWTVCLKATISLEFSRNTKKRHPSPYYEITI